MTNRAGQTLTWDIENRLTAVTGGVSYVYDGDGFRVKKTEGGQTVLYASKYYEKNLSTGVSTLYYYLGDKLVAYKEIPQQGSSTLRYVHQDHLTGTSLTTNADGASAGSIKYKPYGETRSSTSPLPAHKFTGQRLDDIGLYYYGARYYDPQLSRFISADSTVHTAPFPSGRIIRALTVSHDALPEVNAFASQPDDQGSTSIALLLSSQKPGYWVVAPQELNRYTYTLNNPVRYNDTAGNWGKEAALAILGSAVLIPGIGEVAIVVAIGAAVVVAGIEVEQRTGFFSSIRDKARDALGNVLSSVAGTELGRLWDDFQKNPNDWEKVDERPDPKQPKDGESLRELWKNKKTGKQIEVHRLERGGKPPKGHPHPEKPQGWDDAGPQPNSGGAVSGD
ncbi:MAG: RHS repeat-associated core domain-containing protein [Chloroflexi bacterium]|nr:RHS repeat-associated core domain-containing protein [Chloroflexota bacterium]